MGGGNRCQYSTLVVMPVYYASVRSTNIALLSTAHAGCAMDFQHRAGGKTGSGGVASESEANRDRRERLRQLALETIDLAKVRSANWE